MNIRALLLAFAGISIFSVAAFGQGRPADFQISKISKNFVTSSALACVFVFSHAASGQGRAAADFRIIKISRNLTAVATAQHSSPAAAQFPLIKPNRPSPGVLRQERLVITTFPLVLPAIIAIIMIACRGPKRRR